MTHLKKIATIHTDFPEKFGIPRQSGIIDELEGAIVFENEYADPESVKGLEGFSHIWLLWQFDVPDGSFRPTVRPPRLGGNTHMGVFATRSPFRPNPIGLSCVRLEKIEIIKNRPILHVKGADLRDKTAILDIKPYLPFTDAHPEATAGWTKADAVINAPSDNPDIEGTYGPKKVSIPPQLLSLVPEEKQKALIKVLAQDPRPAYHEDPERRYGLLFADMNISFRVEDNLIIVTGIEKNSNP
ncbi:MAG: tRNA (N6-threonylcarbamoyladenosine(37)-N6)-methyltransferase TrmO [Lachnospiraceae bacterium]|nr:tRNA (N6-threonylcarbamoyladenosine(37)-N6)-methyltransferase TrmO [Lachnospiraceae bacterium]